MWNSMSHRFRWSYSVATLCVFGKRWKGMRNFVFEPKDDTVEKNIYNKSCSLARKCISSQLKWMKGLVQSSGFQQGFHDTLVSRETITSVRRNFHSNLEVLWTSGNIFYPKHTTRTQGEGGRQLIYFMHRTETFLTLLLAHFTH